MRIIDGRQVRAARIILGMTVRQMAEAAGIDRKSVLRVEHMKGIRIGWDEGGLGVRSLSAAIEARGVLCDVIDGEPIVRFATTPPPPKYQRRKRIDGPAVE